MSHGSSGSNFSATSYTPFTMLSRSATPPRKPSTFLPTEVFAGSSAVRRYSPLVDLIRKYYYLSGVGVAQRHSEHLLGFEQVLPRAPGRTSFEPTPCRHDGIHRRSDKEDPCHALAIAEHNDLTRGISSNPTTVSASPTNYWKSNSPSLHRAPAFQYRLRCALDSEAPLSR